MKTKKKASLVWFIVYKILLEFTYVKYISPLFSYMGLTAVEPDVFTYVCLWVIYILFCLWARSVFVEGRLSGMVLMAIFMTNFVPSLCMFSYKPSNYQFLFLLYWLFIAWYYRLISYKSKKKHSLGGSPHFLRFVAYCSLIITVFVWAYYARFHVQLDIIQVYEQRELAAGFNMPSVLSYLYAGLNAVIPFFVIASLSMGRKLDAVFFFFAEIVIFFTNGSKSSFFLVFFVVLLFYVMHNHESRIRYIPHSFVALLSAGLAEASILKSEYIIQVIIRRVMFVPVNLDYCYYDFFATREKDYFRQSILRFIGLNSPYGEKIPKIIGMEYFGTPEMSANNGWFSDAYANLGVLGVFLMPLLMVILFKILDRCSSDLDTAILVAPMISLLVLSGSSFFTSLISHGVIMIGIVLYLLPRKKTVS